MGHYRMPYVIRKIFLIPWLKFFLFTWALAIISPATSGTLHVAVAANFHSSIKTLVDKFEQLSGHTVILSSGSSGTLYAQITNGAPYDVFLSADAERPKKLESLNLIVPNSRHTYAEGILALWLPHEQNFTFAQLDTWSNILAIANPKTAPYGLAAQQTLQKLNLFERFSNRLIMGNNVAQTHQFIFSGNIDLGFVALSQVLDAEGTVLVVPKQYYAPIKQQLVILAGQKNLSIAEAFVEFLLSSPTQTHLASLGYRTATSEFSNTRNIAVASR